MRAPLKVRLKADTTYFFRLKADTTYFFRLKADTTYFFRLKAEATITFPGELFSPLPKRVGVERQYLTARDSCRRRFERRDPVVHTRPVRLADARQQVPQREGVTRTCFPDDDGERLCALCAFVEMVHGLFQRGGRVFEIRRAGSRAGPGPADRSGRHQRFTSLEFQCRPARCHSELAGAVLADRHRVGAPQINNSARRRIHDEKPGWCIDFRTDGPSCQCQAVFGFADFAETDTSPGRNVNRAERTDDDARLGTVFRFHPLAAGHPA